MLEFKNVSFKYDIDDFTMLENLSFQVKDHSFVSIIGTSGCGKSTIFRLISKLEKEGSGEILINSKNIREMTNYSAYMPQKDLLFPWRTIEQNVGIPLEIKKVKKGEILRQTDEILRDMGLFDYRKSYPKELSGGMKQRVSFARTILTGSEMLLLDEPFSALDSLTRIELQEWLLKEWQKRKNTIIFVTHDVEEAIFLSEKIFIIKDRPVTKFDMYDVPLSYPRNREDLKKTEISDLREHLISELRQEGSYEK